MAPHLNIGIISENLVQQHYLQAVVKECQHHCVAVFQLRQALANIEQLDRINQQVDAWLVDVDLDSCVDEGGAHFENWLFNLEQPIIFGEGHTHNAAEERFAAWSRQLKEKLQSLTGQLNLARSGGGKPSSLWVLAASTGGPEAVKRFLDSLPEQLDLCFIYAQHIDQYHNQTLAEKICRDSHYDSYIPEHGDSLRTNGVAVIPANHITEIQANGTLMIYPARQWRGDYRPSIDQIVANAADAFKEASGAIFFTGMGDDGASGCRLMALRGGQVWIQSPATCASPSMPNAVDETGCVTAQGSPEQLAELLVDWVRRVK